jgi:uncharacterized protein (TIGR03083 family)
MDIPQTDRLRVEVDPSAMLRAFARHRRRFADAVASLDDDALAHPTRCTEWSVADVLRHGCDVDGWFRTAAAGDPTPFLDASFDTVTTPHELVVAQRAVSDAYARDRFVESSYAMASEVDASCRDRWDAPGASPIQGLFDRFGVSIGRIPWWLGTLHHFLDSFVHERDVLIPLGTEPPQIADETVPVLAYILAVSGLAAFGPIDVTVAGVRVVCGDGPLVSTPVAPRADVAPVIDALTGRGNLHDVIDGLDDDAVHRLSRVGKFLAGAYN